MDGSPEVPNVGAAEGSHDVFAEDGEIVGTKVIVVIVDDGLYVESDRRLDDCLLGDFV